MHKKLYFVINFVVILFLAGNQILARDIDATNSGNKSNVDDVTVINKIIAENERAFSKEIKAVNAKSENSTNLELNNRPRSIISDELSLDSYIDAFYDDNLKAELNKY